MRFTRFLQWQVVESAQEVRILAQIERRSGDCTADLLIRPEKIELDAPLGDRLLTGCQNDEPGACHVVRPRT